MAEEQTTPFVSVPTSAPSTSVNYPVRGPSLRQVMTLNPVCERVETSQGVPLTVTGVAQVKFLKQEELLKQAFEQFISKSVDDVKNTVLQTMEGHLRAILGRK